MVLMKDGFWITRLGFCLCLLGGQACLNGQAFAVENEKVRITIADVFDRYDVDENGILESDECVCESSKRCDLNQDGKVTRSEFSKAVAKHAGSHKAALKMISQMGGIEKYYALAKGGQLDKETQVSMDSVFAQWDRDKSGVLESHECVCQCSKSADADKDGTVTKQEFTYLVERYFGNEDKFLAMVRQRGGVEAFYNGFATEASTFGAVFARYDTNNSGSLEPGEWVCENSKLADYDRDGKVTRDEMVVMVKRAFGSVERFEQYVKHQGGAAKFYAQRQR